MKKIVLVFRLVLILSISFQVNAQWFWQPAGGPYSGSINAIAIDQQNNLLYCGDWGGGNFRSRDNGEHWEEINDGITNGNIRSIIVSDNGTVFAGNTTGILKSANFGNYWQYCFDTIGWTISFAKDSRGWVYAGTNRGEVYRTTDNGINWTEIYNDNNNWIYSIAIDSIDNIYLGTSYYGILFSDDGGITWREKNTGFRFPLVQSISIQPNTGKLFVGANDGVYVSDNLGDEWVRIDSTLNVHSIYFLSTGEIIARTYFSLYLSNDQGFNWIPITSNTIVESQSLNCCLISKQDEIFVGNAGDGIFFSSDKGSTWMLRTEGISNVQFKALAIDSNDNIYTGSFYSGISKSTDQGATFTRVNTGLSYKFITSLGSNDDNHIFAGTPGEGVYRTTNEGENWEPINNGLQNTGIKSIKISKNGSIFLGTEGGLYRSNNNGNSWNNFAFNGKSIVCLELDTADNIFVGIYDYTNPNEPIAQVFRSTNNGLNWIKIFESYSVNSVHISKKGDYFIATSNSIYHSTDQGSNWSVSGVPNQIYLIVSNDKNYIYLGTINGVYCSTDDGFSWVEISEGLPSSVKDVNCLAFDSMGFLYAGVTNFTLYKSIVSTTSVDNDIQTLKNFFLSQNYPNPFNPSTKISWQSPVSSWQTLKVYDILGNEIATLVDEYRNAGSYEYDFNYVETLHATSLPSGVYFYQLRVDNFVETKKMILLK